MGTPRSGCPINQSVEILGDRWTLVVLRDMIFGDGRHFSALHRDSLEGIATNVLADRLDKLVENGLLTRHQDPSHRQRTNYRLTESAIQLVPVLATLGAWGSAWLPVSDELSARAKVLAEGGPELWEQFMDELRAEHLGSASAVHRPTVRDLLDDAYQSATASDPQDRPAS
jgi:DNA-binding HxlR family transcriptional regulator